MKDKRKVPRLSNPTKSGRFVQVNLNGGDYHEYFMVVMASGKSGSECLRDLIHKAYDNLPEEDKI